MPESLDGSVGLPERKLQPARLEPSCGIAGIDPHGFVEVAQDRVCVRSWTTQHADCGVVMPDRFLWSRKVTHTDALALVSIQSVQDECWYSWIPRQLRDGILDLPITGCLDPQLAVCRIPADFESKRPIRGDASHLCFVAALQGDLRLFWKRVAVVRDHATAKGLADRRHRAECRYEDQPQRHAAIILRSSAADAAHPLFDRFGSQAGGIAAI